MSPAEKRMQRTLHERLVDAAIDISAETGFISATAAEICRRAGAHISDFERTFPSRADLAVAAVDEIFARRIETYFENAGRLESSATGPEPGLQALSDQFPDQTWIAYWDVLFAVRGDEAAIKKIRATTTKYDHKFIEVIPRYFPDGTPLDVLVFTIGHFDGLGLDALVAGSTDGRAAQIEILSDLLKSTAAAR